MEFYVYLYCDPKTLVPFYAGKGKGNRAWSHLTRVDKAPMTYKIRKLQREGLTPVISVLFCETEELAFLAEVEMIDKYGRKDQKTGTLLNLTDGGEGVSGYAFSSDQISRRAESQKQTWRSKRLDLFFDFTDDVTNLVLKIGDTVPSGFYCTNPGAKIGIDGARVLCDLHFLNKHQAEEQGIARKHIFRISDEAKAARRAGCKGPKSRHSQPRAIFCVNKDTNEVINLFCGQVVPEGFSLKHRGRFYIDNNRMIVRHDR